MDNEQRIQRALDFAAHGTTEDAAEKAWVIDQIVRTLLGCTMVAKHAPDGNGGSTSYCELGESPDYRAWVQRFPEWDRGVAP